MRKIVLAICAAVVMLGGCTEPEMPMPPVPPTPTENGDETVVTFTFGVDNPVAATRAVDENSITNLQLALFGVDGTRYDFNPGDKSFLLATIKPGKYTVYASSACMVPFKVFSEASINLLFSSVPDETATAVPMTFKGTADFSVGKSNSYTVKLVRTVAKLRFNVTTASNVTITGMSLQNAPRQTKLFPQANPGYNFAERAIGATGGAFTLYMPEHLAGTVSSITNQRQRTAANAPANATYLLIEGEVTNKIAGDGYTVSRKGFESVVYLGGNVTDDFNIRRNNDYRININIAADLSTDTRIELYRVGYNSNKRLTADGKYIWYERIRFTLFYNEGETWNSTEKVTYKFQFDGFTSGKMKINGQYLTGNTVSKSIDVGRSDVIDLGYDDISLYTPENHLIKYTLTFTDDYGGTTVYPGELRFCNILDVAVRPQTGSVKKADVVFTTPDLTIAEFQPSDTYDYKVYSVAKSITMKITPRAGYTFKGWYSYPECLDKHLISTSTTLVLTPDYKRTNVYAKVE